MASSCRCNVNFARKCSLTHLQAQRKFTSAGCHPQVGTAIQCSIYVPYVRTVRLHSTSVQYVHVPYCIVLVRVPVSCTQWVCIHSTCKCTVYTSTIRVYSARRICQTVELLRQRKKAAESCNGNLRRMPFRDVSDDGRVMGPRPLPYPSIFRMADRVG